MNELNSHSIVHEFEKKSRYIFIILFTLVGVAVFAGSIIGPASLSWDSFASIFSMEKTLIHELIWEIRLPRVILGLLAGGALAICGCALQSLFNNPLADTGLIGVSSGAMIGVMIGVLFAGVFNFLKNVLSLYSFLILPFLAFIGAMVLGFIVYRLSLSRGRVQLAIMLLSGIAINAFAGAFSGLMINMADDEQLRTITFWSMGSLNAGSWKIILILSFFVIGGSLLLIRRAKELDALGLGEREAIYLGVDTDKIKKEVIIISAFICGPVVAFVGLIGFVGVVIPHILRMIQGPKNSTLMISSFFLGGIFLIFCDIISKVILAPSELPIGIITSLIGTPFFTYLLIKEKKRLGND